MLESVTIMTSQCGIDGRGPMRQLDTCLPRRRDYCTLQQQLEAVGRATGEALPEDGTLSIVRRGAGYQVRYAANNPYAAEHAPWTCPDEATLCAWLAQVGIEAEALQHACSVARQGCVAVLCLRVAPAQLHPCLCPTP
jgi:hypothetical protein